MYVEHCNLAASLPVVALLLMRRLFFRLRAFCFDIKNTFLSFVDKNNLLGTVSHVIQPLFYAFV